jgi:indole-3-glycerol phosphate synthase
MPDTMLADALTTIIGAKYLEVEEGLRATSLHEMERLALAAPTPRDFQGALCATVAQGRTGLIAEMKRRSPSGGEIRPGFDAGEVARAYAGAGAACLSVLTDERWFGGSPADLKAARKACALPVLRKDFLVHPWQVFQSRAMGADAVLLIMSVLSDEQASELEEVARSLDMAVLAEAHDRRELDRALGLQTRLIGVNNRDLKTLTTDLGTSEALVPLIPADRIPVAESGIRTAADVARMAAAGAFTILVGEHLLRQPDLAGATRALLA